MNMNVNVKGKNPLLIIWETLAGNGNKEESKIEEEIKKIEAAGDTGRINDLLDMVKPPVDKKSAFGTNKVNAKVQDRRIEVQRTEKEVVEEKSFEGR